MIQSAQEFIVKVKGYFDTDNMSMELEDAYKSWLRKKNLKPLEFESLYDLSTENFAHIPKVNLLAKVWHERGEKISKGESFSSANNAVEFNKDKNWQTIIEDLKYLRKNQEIRDLTTKEIDYLHEWDDLMCIYNLLNMVPAVIMPQTYKDTYLRKVREDIIAGIPINLGRVRAKIDERNNTYSNIYGEQERKQDSKIERTVQQIERTFADNSKMFQPEPDKMMNFDF